jgi:hypothetical protein
VLKGKFNLTGKKLKFLKIKLKTLLNDLTYSRRNFFQ